MCDAVALAVEDTTLRRHALFMVASTADEFDTDAFVEDMKTRLPLYMAPSSVVVRAAIPRSPDGTFDRTQLREELAT